LITGGAGFIGSNLAHKLVELKAKVTILDAFLPPYGANLFNLYGIKKNIKLIRGDIRSVQTVEKAVKNQDIVIHLAAQTGRTISMSDPNLDTQINVVGTLNLLEAIRKLKRKPKLIFSSSRGVYGKPQKLPVDEITPTNPVDIYGTNKLTAEKYCLLYSQLYSIPTVIFRLNNIYGPRCQIKSNHYGTLNLFVAYALVNKQIPIYGRGDQTRDFLYIDDVVDAIIVACQKEKLSGVYMLGSGYEHSILEIIMILKKQFPLITYKFIKYPPGLNEIDPKKFRSKSNKFMKISGWKPKIEFETGIWRTVDYYRANIKKYL
jgi:nucleoside-diphosphate-sugar epimerase